MEKTIDLLGLLCPAPVLRTKKLRDDTSINKVEALVESEVNVNNLQRLARSLKCRFDAKSEEAGFRVTLERGQGATASDAASHAHPIPAVTSTKTTDPTVGTVV